MGVKGLQTYIDNKCPHVKKRISIYDMAEQHRSYYNVTPKLVIDGMALINNLYCDVGGLEWIYGGQWLEYSNVLRQFIKKFSDKNINVAFFFDGCVVPEKRNEWINRRIQKYNEIAVIFDHLRNQQPLPKNVDQFKLPTSMGNLSSLAIKVLCPEVEVYSTLNDADVEIANFARKNQDVFGILSNDTDFIIFDTKPYLNSRDLDYATMCTTVYDRDLLSQHLSLHKEQFPLFACLVGNDFMTREDLKRFHYQIRTYRQQPIPEAVSSVISRHQWSGNHNNEHELNSILRIVCGNQKVKDNLFRGIAMYKDFYLPTKASCIIGLRHVDCTNITGVFNTYKHCVYESSEVLEDHLDSTLPPTNLAYRDLRKRLYCIMFNSVKHKKSLNGEIAVQEWCAYYGNKLEKPDFIYPSSNSSLDNAPPLEHLWQEGSSSQKLQYFLACLQIPLTESEIQDIEPKFVVLCGIMSYLLTNFETPLLQKFEVIAFLAQAVYIQDKTLQQIHDIKVQYIDSRVVHLSSLFMRGVAAIIFALGVCGYPITLENAMPWKFFDGKVFHKMYRLAKEKTSTEDLFEKKESAMELYEKLYNKATFGVKRF